MKPYLIVLLPLACFTIGILFGANNQPILTGSGYIKWPENAIPANCVASSGALTCTAGGSNQGITLNSTGTGQHTFQLQGNVAAVVTDNGHSPEGGYYVTRNSTGAIGFVVQNTDNETLLFDAHRNSGGFVADGTSAARFLKTTAKLFFSGKTGLTAGNNFTFSTNAGALDLSNNNWGFGGNTAPGYSVDVTGDVNVSSGYLIGAAATSGNVLRGDGTRFVSAKLAYTDLSGTPSAILSGVTGSISGNLTLGTCDTGTATVTGATTSMTATASPTTFPGTGITWGAYVSGSNTVTVVECGLTTITPTATTYQVRVIP